MLRRLLQHAGDLGCAEAWVLTDRANQGAMRLYEASGAVEAAGNTVMFNFPITNYHTRV